MNIQRQFGREQLLDLLAKEGISDPRVLEAMGRVPRERFVPDGLREHAYRNSPLPIGLEQTISQPLMVAVMVEALRIEPAHRVLEVGTGLGYEAAVLAELASEVFSVERHEPLATAAAERLRDAGYAKVQVRQGDGSHGWVEHAPYDGIVVAAASREVPLPLLEQLRIGGRLVIPYEFDSRNQQLFCITRVDEHRFAHENLGGVRFVPLVTG
jgi:protein-L-isoaspartate(D-aspartate) O-methyltransferase